MAAFFLERRDCLKMSLARSFPFSLKVPSRSRPAHSAAFSDNRRVRKPEWQGRL